MRNIRHNLGTCARVRGNLFSDSLRKAAGIEGSLHRCRHYFGTELLREGVSTRVIQTLMRHESLATTENYLAVDEAERVAAIRRLAA